VIEGVLPGAIWQTKRQKPARCTNLGQAGFSLFRVPSDFHARLPLDETVFRHRRSRPETDVSLAYRSREGRVSVFVFEILIF
jgi:hypothetical protein